ncbi:MAG TPA: 4Fe-4S binding protein [Dehalococcoidia bacterium]|nr:4Fe-4S binding protein [Dehalococcoidia bacterium]
MSILKSAADLEKLREDILSGRDPNKCWISICGGTGCLALGAGKVISAFERELKEHGLDTDVEVKITGCPGFCERGSLVVIKPENILYQQVREEHVPDIVSRTIIKGEIVDDLLYVDGETGEKVVHEDDVPFYRRQLRLLLADNSKIDPNSIDDYIALGGYAALAKALLEMSPEDVVEEVKQAGLRGRGGGGFPAGIKWETTRNAPSDIRYVIVNADEGDPGAFMDRSLLEGNPHSVLEGLIIGAYAIGASQGFVYVRQEYPLTVENVNIAIGQMREYGLIGDNILGSGFNFDIAVHRGAGAFVSGESSALMTAIEGKVGEPRPKYIRTAVSGIHGKPSNLNNVETWANVPLIIKHGSKWYSGVGTEGSKGTKIFSLVGKVNNTGLVEVPMGMPLREIIYSIGGGILNEKKFKAVQTGGPSGGVIPEELLDLPVDFDELSKAGSMMGSGGMIVMDEDTCVVDVARYFLDFLSDESCGKCIPCREGIEQMVEILNRICGGEGIEGDIETLQDLGDTMQECALCALGQSAPNPVMSTIQYFKKEYEDHIARKCCPAGACKALVNYYIEPDKCQACMICLRNCPVGAIEGGKNLVHTINQDKCTKCGTCLEVCPTRFSAVTKLSGVEIPGPVAAGTTVR